MTTKTVTIPIKLLNDNDISVHEAALTLEYPEGLGVAFLDGFGRSFPRRVRENRRRRACSPARCPDAQGR